MTSPLIDVLIPAYNAGRTIRSALESIQLQTVRDIRIIVINDGSTDDTAAILAEMAKADARIEIVAIPNGGIVDALNHGLQFCRAPYLARHDSDDLAYPDRFAKQIAYLDAHPDCVAVGGGAWHIDEAGRDLKHLAIPPSPDAADPFWAPTNEPLILHPFLMTRLASVKAVGGYRHVFHAEDVDLYWRLQEIGRLYNLPEALGQYRLHPNSISSKSICDARVSALNSQLAGLSAIRRRGNKTDLTFPKERLAEYRTAEFMESMFRLGCRDLTTEEAAYLKLRFAAKVIDLASYRPFELDVADCRFVRDAIRSAIDTLQPANQATLTRMCNGAVARLMSKGRVRLAFALLWPRLYVGALSRVLFRVALPDKVRRPFMRALRRPAFYK